MYCVTSALHTSFLTRIFSCMSLLPPTLFHTSFRSYFTQHNFFDPSPESASASPHSDTIGDSAIIGDDRWAGTFGVKADFVATTHCSVAFISTQEIQVPVCEPGPLRMLSPWISWLGALSRIYDKINKQYQNCIHDLCVWLFSQVLSTCSWQITWSPCSFTCVLTLLLVCVHEQSAWGNTSHFPFPCLSFDEFWFWYRDCWRNLSSFPSSAGSSGL